MIEAMAVGLPVIVTPVGSIPDAVKPDQEAILVPPREVAALADAIERLAGDPNLRQRMGEAARARAQSTFTVEAAADRLVRLVRDEPVDGVAAGRPSKGTLHTAPPTGTLP
jgi:glycosyltransferase involved in cell wall biosynthesis